MAQVTEVIRRNNCNTSILELELPFDITMPTRLGVRAMSDSLYLPASYIWPCTISDRNMGAQKKKAGERLEAKEKMEPKAPFPRLHPSEGEAVDDFFVSVVTLPYVPEHIPQAAFALHLPAPYHKVLLNKEFEAVVKKFQVGHDGKLFEAEYRSNRFKIKSAGQKHKSSLSFTFSHATELETAENCLPDVLSEENQRLLDQLFPGGGDADDDPVMHAAKRYRVQDY